MIRSCPGWMGLHHGYRVVSDDGVNDGKNSTVLCDECKRHTAALLAAEEAARLHTPEQRAVGDRVNRAHDAVGRF